MTDLLEGERIDHLSYGAISVNTTSGRTHLFMSEAEHSYYVTVEIHTAYAQRSLANDKMFADKMLVRVHLTYAQWAEFLSSMGQGNGVPCTFSYQIGKGQIPSPPPPPSKADKFKDDLKAHLASVMKRARELRERVKQAADFGRAGKGDLTGFVHDIAMLEQELRSNLPFVATQFQASVEETLSAARIEADAYLARRTQELGMSAAMGEKPDPALPEGDQ